MSDDFRTGSVKESAQQVAATLGAIMGGQGKSRQQMLIEKKQKEDEDRRLRNEQEEAEYSLRDSERASQANMQE